MSAHTDLIKTSAIEWWKDPTKHSCTLRTLVVSAQQTHIDVKDVAMVGPLKLQEYWLPAVRRQLFDLAVLVCWQASQHILEVGIRIMPIELGVLPLAEN